MRIGLQFQEIEQSNHKATGGKRNVLERELSAPQSSAEAEPLAKLGVVDHLVPIDSTTREEEFFFVIHVYG